MPRVQRGRGPKRTRRPPSPEAIRKHSPPPTHPGSREKTPFASEETLHCAVDARNHVYLHSFMAMEDPLRQIRIEYPELERQWSELSREKESMGLGDGDKFLEKHDILEFGLDDDFVQRYNLSVMIHRIAMPELDLKKCGKALKGYARIFRKQLEHDAQVPDKDIFWRMFRKQPENDAQVPGRDVFWRVYVQMVDLIMALRTQSGIDVSSYDPIELFENAWALEDIPKHPKHPKQTNTTCPVRVTNATKNFLRDVAIRASTDVVLLDGIYDSILRLVIQQLKEQLIELQDPVETSLVEDLTARRDTELQRYYNQAQVSQLNSTTPSISPTAPPISPLSVSATTLPSVPQAGINLDDNINVRSLVQSKERQLQSASSSERLESPSPRPPILSSAQTSIPPPASPLEQHSSPPFEGQLTPSSPSPPATHRSISPPSELPLSSATKKKPLGLIDRVSRVAGIVSMSAKGDSDSEFEDDGDDIPPIELKKGRKLPLVAASVKKTEVTDKIGAPEKEHMGRKGDVSDKGLYTHRSAVPLNVTAQPDVSTRLRPGKEGNAVVKPGTLKGKMLIGKASPKEKGTAKERKKTRPWTTEEEDYLMKLVPWFLHETSPTSQRQRKVRWAQLKRYDEAHGNVLQYRDQVMLKDKYRQKTDKGRHSDYVNRVQQAKASSVPRHQFPGDQNNVLLLSNS